MSTNDSAVVEAKKKDTIKIEVNKKKVKVHGARQTGLQIKQAAIAEGVEIELDFQLTKKVGDKWKVVGDAEVFEVVEDEKFRAVHGDDNS